MGVASPSQASRRQESRFVAIIIKHRRLRRTISKAIQAFLRNYDQYAREDIGRAMQLAGATVLSTKISKPVQMEFCVNYRWRESVIDLGYIPIIGPYENLSDDELWPYLKSKAASLKDVVKINMLDKIDNYLRIDSTNKKALSKIENSFVSYKSILHCHYLSWMTDENEKVAVYHVLSSICPETLQDRFESDLYLSRYDLRQDFKGFMAHAIKWSKSFQLVDNGPPTKLARTG